MSKRNRQANTDESDVKLHYKMYKAGKRWLFAGIMFIGVGAAVVAGGNVASADTNTAASAEDVVQTAPVDTTKDVTQATDKSSTTDAVNGKAPTAPTTAPVAQQDDAAVVKQADHTQPESSVTAKSAGTGQSANNDSAAQNTSKPAATVSAPIAITGTTTSDPTASATTASTTVDPDSKPAATVEMRVASNDVNDVNAAKTAAIATAAKTGAKQLKVVAVAGPVNPADQHVTVTKDNFAQYFNVSGDYASYDPTTGIVTLTADEKSQSGNATLKNKIDLTQSFTLKGAINLGDKQQKPGNNAGDDFGGGDGIAFGFHGGNTDEVGGLGSGVGISTLADAFGWKADTFFDNIDETYNHTRKDLSRFMTGDPSKDDYGIGDPYGAFIYNDDQGNVTAYDEPTTPDAAGAAKIISQPDNQFKDISISYDGSTKMMTINYDGKTWQKDISGWANGATDTDFLMAASTAGATNLQQFKFGSFDYYTVPSVDVEYVIDGGTHDGELLGTGQATYPNGKMIGETYTTTAKTFEGYSFEKVINASGENSGNGTLVDAGNNGTVMYYYTPVIDVLATWNMRDVTSGTIIEQTNMEGNYNEAPTSGGATFTLLSGYRVIPEQPDHDRFTVSADGQSVTYTGVMKLDKSDDATVWVIDTKELAKTLTRQITYLVAGNGVAAPTAETQTVNYQNTATYSLANDFYTVTHTDWVTTDSFAGHAAPPLAGYTADQDVPVVTMSQDIAFADGNQLVNPAPVVITYYPDNVTVTPDKPKEPNTNYDPRNPKSPKYPGGLTDQDLRTTAVETVRFVDDASGAQVADSVTSQMDFERSADVNLKNGTVTYHAWQPVASPFFATVPVPDVAGKFTPVDEVPSVAEAEPAPVTLTVYYFDKRATVTPDQPRTPGEEVDAKVPNSPRYPAGTEDANLNRTATETIRFIDAKTGQTVAPAQQQTVKFQRTATVDLQQGKLVGYGAWQPNGDATFPALTNMPDVTGKFTTVTAVPAMPETEPAPVTLTVYYYDTTGAVTPDGPKAPGTTVDEKVPNAPVYPDGVKANDLHRTVTETIRFVDENTGKPVAPSRQQAVKFQRTATVNFQTGTVNYGEWEPDGNTTFPALTTLPDVTGKIPTTTSVPAEAEVDPAPLTLTVYYQNQYVTVTPQSPKFPGQPTNSNNPDGPKYPTGVAPTDLNAVGMRTINFVNGDGTPVHAPVHQIVEFERYGVVDLKTGKVVYTPWVAPKGLDYPVVVSPSVPGLTPNVGQVPAQPASPSDNVTAQVVYGVTPATGFTGTPTDGTPTPGNVPTETPVNTPTGTNGTPASNLPSTFGNNDGGDGSATTGSGTNAATTQNKQTGLPSTGGAASQNGNGTGSGQKGNQAQLPQTGDSKSSALSLIGAGLVAVLGMIGLAGVRKHEGN